MSFVTPDFHMPAGRAQHPPQGYPLAKEARLHDFKRDAVLAFLSANRINRVISAGGRAPKVGILTGGKAYLDVLQALDELGIDEVEAPNSACASSSSAAHGRSSRDGSDALRRRARYSHRRRGEARADRKPDQANMLYGAANRPLCIGKKDERGQLLFPASGALDAIAIAHRASASACSNVSRAKTCARASTGCATRRRQRAGTADVAERARLFLLRLSA